MRDDPFGALGLPGRAGLSDEDVRAAWRRIAAATHPDRDDGGDPARFAAAASAYQALRTTYGRGEALADLGLAGRAPRPAHRAARHARRPGAPPGRDVGEPRDRGEPRGLRGRSVLIGRWRLAGRWRRLALRAAVAAVGLTAALLAAGWTPATVGLLAGALTWLAAASRPGSRGRGGA
jgi:curved DNA-binding protein CbpA